MLLGCCSGCCWGVAAGVAGVSLGRCWGVAGCVGMLLLGCCWIVAGMLLGSCSGCCWGVAIGVAGVSHGCCWNVAWVFLGVLVCCWRCYCGVTVCYKMHHLHEPKSNVATVATNTTCNTFTFSPFRLLPYAPNPTSVTQQNRVSSTMHIDSVYHAMLYMRSRANHNTLNSIAFPLMSSPPHPHLASLTNRNQEFIGKIKHFIPEERSRGHLPRVSKV